MSNMSEHFSKLNKLSQSFSAKKPIDLAKSISGKRSEKLSKPIFTVGNRDISGHAKEKSGSGSSGGSSSSSSGGSCCDDDDDENIEMTRMHVVEKPANFSHDKHLMEAYTPSIGIIMGVKNNVMDGEICENNVNAERSATNRRNNNSADSKPDIALDALFLIPQSGASALGGSTQKTAAATTPEITVYDAGENPCEESERTIMPPPSALTLARNISHSTGEVDNKMSSSSPSSGVKGTTLQTDGRLDKKRSASDQDLTLNITSSQSESALKSIKENIASVTSPVASTAKDILLPFSKLARGVQTLGANLDPRKLKTGHAGMSRNLSEHHIEERQKLQEKWTACQSRLIAL